MYNPLQYISQGLTADEQLQNITQALKAGCRWIQLRYKQADEQALLQLAQKAKALCQAHEATFIINDHPHLAQAIDADGVHLGLGDMPVQDARSILGNNKIIGGTANTLDDVLMRANERCDYIGLGPFRFTATKEKLSPILGLEGYRTIMEVLQQKQIAIPVYAIGGITATDVPELMQTGVYGIAVSGIITQHPDKFTLVQQLNHDLHVSTTHRG